MDKKKDRLLIVFVLVILFLILWLVRCSKPDYEQYVSADTCSLVIHGDTLCDTIVKRQPRKASKKKQDKKPIERNYLDEKLSE